MIQESTSNAVAMSAALSGGLNFPAKTLRRATRAAACSPFRLGLFLALRQTAVPLQDIAGTAGIAHGYSRRNLNELIAENELMWLMQVGLLRREVDGQGLTNRFRLTPLGQQLVLIWQQQGDRLPPAGLRDRFYNAVCRWLRLPF